MHAKNEPHTNSLTGVVVCAMGKAVLQKNTATCKGNTWTVEIAVDETSKWSDEMTVLQEVMRSVNPNARLELNDDCRALVILCTFSWRNTKGMQTVTKTAAEFLEAIGRVTQPSPLKVGRVKKASTANLTIAQRAAKAAGKSVASTIKEPKALDGGLTAAQRTYLAGDNRLWNRSTYLAAQQARRAQQATAS
jgi:hypothetical protein